MQPVQQTINRLRRLSFQQENQKKESTDVKEKIRQLKDGYQG